MHKLVKFAYKAMYLIGVFSLVASTVLSTGVTPALASGQGSENCPNPSVSDITGSGTSVSYNAGSGKIVTAVCIKSGAAMFGPGNQDQHSGALGNGLIDGYSYTGCYQVSGVGTQTVTVTKLGSGSNCKDISHIDIFYENAPPPPPSEGCTDEDAGNFDGDAEVDDGSCWYWLCEEDHTLGTTTNKSEWDTECTVIINGCTDDTAINYNPEATQGNDDAAKCVYVSLSITSDACEKVSYSISGTNLHGVEIGYTFEIWGDDGFKKGGGSGFPILHGTFASNNIDPAEAGLTYTLYVWADGGSKDDAYKSATVGPVESCTETVLGCDDDAAINYNPGANDNDGSCVYLNVSVNLVCEEVKFIIQTINLSGTDLGGWSFEIFEDGEATPVDFGSVAGFGAFNDEIRTINPATAGKTYTLYVWMGTQYGEGPGLIKSLTSGEVEGCPSTLVEVPSLTDPSALVCEEVTFVIYNDGLLEIPLVTWQIYTPDFNLVDSGTIDNFAASAQLEVLLENATPELTYTLYAWIGAAGPLGEADSSETSGEVEECEEPGDPGDPEITTTTLIPVTGAPVSGVLIPVTGFDAAGQAAFLASMAANMGFGSLGAGLLLHGLSLRKKNKKDE